MRALIAFLVAAISTPTVTVTAADATATARQVTVTTTTRQEQPLSSSSSSSSFCFSSTTSILLAQLQSPPILDIVLCPNTVFQIGVPSNGQGKDFAGGDVPLMALHDNMTFTCGSSNSVGNDSNSTKTTTLLSDNMCVVSGGFIQFWTRPTNPFLSSSSSTRNTADGGGGGGGSGITTHNLKLQGITFTGDLWSPPPPPPTTTTASTFPTTTNQALWFQAPGTNMVIEDCIFTDMVADTIISNAASFSRDEDNPQEENVAVAVAVAAGGYYPSYSSSLTIVDSFFSNIQWKQSVLTNDFQTMNLRTSQMDNVYQLLSVTSEEVDTVNTTTNNATTRITALPYPPRVPIWINNGISEIIDNVFANMNVSTSIAYLSDDYGIVDSFGFDENEALNIQVVSDGDGGSRDGGPTTMPCPAGLWIEQSYQHDNSTTVPSRPTLDCVRFFENYDTTAPTTTPTSSPTILQCFGICGLGGTLMNPETVIRLDGTSPDSPIEVSCQDMNLGMFLFPPRNEDDDSDNGPCATGQRAAQLAGCQCEVDGVLITAAPIPPTRQPTVAPTTMVVPIPTPIVTGATAAKPTTPTAATSESSSSSSSDGAKKSRLWLLLFSTTTISTTILGLVLLW